MSNTDTMVMNRDALGQIIADCDEYLTSLNRDEDDVWQMGFAACMQWIGTYAAPIVAVCDADYGDAEGPVLNQAALTYLVGECERRYEAAACAGSDSLGWLSGVSAGIQRLEMFGGDIVADCT